MARLRTIRLTALNIVTHPHSPANYVDLLYDILDIDDPVQVRGTKASIITMLWTSDEDSFWPKSDKKKVPKSVSGIIATFDRINFGADWLSLKSKKSATENELAEIRIPRHIHPNAQYFLFTFFPRKHVMYVVTEQQYDRLTPGAAATVFRKFCEKDAIASKYGKVEVSVLPDQEKLEEIFRLPRMRKVHLEFALPNPDQFDDPSKGVYKRFKKMGAGRVVQELTALATEKLTPDHELKTYMQVAADNGYVTAEGSDDQGKKIVLSTRDHPYKAELQYDPKLQTEVQAFELRAYQLYGQLPKSKDAE